MTDTQRLLFQTEMLKHRKSVGVAAVLCFLGPFGVHRFYLGQIGMGLLYLCTFGLLVVGAVVDLLSIRRLVERVNFARAQVVAEQIRGLDSSGGATRIPLSIPAPAKPKTNVPRLVVLLIIMVILAWLAGAFR